jgi:hypothetical protein
MSERSIYLRDEADKCVRHADAMSDALTQRELRRLASLYVVQAVEIESEEANANLLPPTLWPILLAPEGEPQPA